jgi:mercuric ion binding protein
MKQKLFALIAIFLMAGFVNLAAAQDKKSNKDEVTFLVSMTCENCRQRIQDNIAYEKGVTDLRIDLEKKLVTIEYRTDKTNPDKLKQAIRKLGYTVTPYKPKKEEPKPKA